MIARLSVLFLWALAFLWLLAPRGGLRAVYSVETGTGTLVPLYSRVDPGVDFVTPERLQQPFYQHWDLRTLGVPESLPPFQVRWTGLLFCRNDGRYRFHLEASGQVRLLIDGRALSPEPGKETEGSAADLSPGWHPFDLTYRRSDQDPRIRLFWEEPGSASSLPVPRSALAPSEAALGARRAALVAGSILAAGWLLVVARAWRRRREAGSLGEFIAAHRHGIALAAILLLALALRLHEYDLIPFHAETADEYQHGWEGWSLLHEGTPRAWTFYPWIYPRENTNPFFWFGHVFYVAHPYFDHPPGFSLLVGGLCSLLGADQLLDCTLWRMRLVPILLGLLTVGLVARAGWSLLADPRAGTLAALLYATLPTIVLGNRLVKAENLLAPLLLIQALWLERFLRDRARGDLLRIAAAGVVAMWAKATGVALPAIALLQLGAARRWKAMAVVAGAAAVAVLLYIGYGAFFGWGIFTTVMRLQASKVVAVRTLLDLAGISRVVELQFGTGWYLWLVLAAGWMALGPERKLLAAPALYFLLLCATADVRGVYGWYRLPIYPFLCLAGGKFLCDWWVEKDLSHAFLFAVTALATSCYHALPIAGEKSRLSVWGIFALCCAVPVADILLRSPRISRLRSWSVALPMAVFFAANIIIVREQLPIYLQEAVRGKVPGVGGAHPSGGPPESPPPGGGPPESPSPGDPSPSPPTGAPPGG
jgi:dolichyl-phosphate-mannose-protein mannosyltransferase